MTSCVYAKKNRVVGGKFTFNNLLLDSTVIEGLEFILSHLEEPLFPRTISTKTTEGRQILVNSRQEVLARFKQAEYKDCRINAFPSYTEHRGKTIQKSNFIFIDIDRNQFTDDESLERAVKQCLDKLKEVHAYPTVLDTGNGYHIYQPIKGIVLEDYSDFSEFGIGRISQKFLKFASIYFSNGKSDPNNNPSFKNCLLRVPNTINSKSNDEVKIIQRWNEHRPSINLMIGDFYVYLRSQKIKEEKILRGLANNHTTNTNANTKTNHLVPWIETLLNIGIEDYRKNTISLILSPYLIYTRKLGPNEAHKIINTWLEKCDKVRKLDFNADRKINYDINTALKTKYKHMRLDTLKTRNKALYHLVTERIKQ